MGLVLPGLTATGVRMSKRSTWIELAPAEPVDFFRAHAGGALFMEASDRLEAVLLDELKELRTAASLRRKASAPFVLSLCTQSR